MNTILSLCDHSGNWSKPYEDAGYVVIRIDIQDHGILAGDARLVKYMPPVHGIIAAPPCTYFSFARGKIPTREELLDGLSIADACVRLAMIHKPKWWVLENPVGRLEKWYGPPTMKFQPYHFGDPWTKPTCLWGEFTKPQKHTFSGEAFHLVGGSKTHTKQSVRSVNDRSKTPQGFAKAFFEANP